MRVVWTRSGFLTPRFFCSASLSLIQSSRSSIESVPTESLIRCSGISLTHGLDGHQLRAFRNLASSRNRNAGDAAAVRRGQSVLHLHRLDNNQALTLFHLF